VLVNSSLNLSEIWVLRENSVNCMKKEKLTIWEIDYGDVQRGNNHPHNSFIYVMEFGKSKLVPIKTIKI
jgi:hypothetical protein